MIMKYKVGDRVILKKRASFTDDVHKDLEKLPRREVTIEDVVEDTCLPYYYMNEIEYEWYEDEIECLVKEKKCLPIPVITRFDLMDFED
jgi:hypothetical protein